MADEALSAEYREQAIQWVADNIAPGSVSNKMSFVQYYLGNTFTNTGIVYNALVEQRAALLASQAAVRELREALEALLCADALRAPGSYLIASNICRRALSRTASIGEKGGDAHDDS